MPKINDVDFENILSTYYGDVVPHWYTYPPKSSYEDATSIAYEDLRLSQTEHISVYIHIPFCNMKCSFCSLFTTAGGSLEEIDYYVEQVVREIRTFISKTSFTNLIVDSLYVGGGTPSVLSNENIDRLMSELDNLGVNISTKKSLEFSPEATDKNRAKHWRSHGFLRASIGIQSFNDERLNKLRRHHTADDAKQALSILAREGFTEINADLIFGHEDQSHEEWSQDLHELLKTDATSCTFHPLAVQSKTQFERRITKKAETGAQRSSKHELALSILKTNNWHRTSAISASRNAYVNPIEETESRGIPTIGFGAGARTYIDELHLSTLPASRRMAFSRVLSEYYSAVEQGRKPAMSQLVLSAEEQIRRHLILKIHHGYISHEEIEACKQHQSTSPIPLLLEAFENNGFLERCDAGFRLTNFGAIEFGQIGALLASDQVQTVLKKKVEDNSKHLSLNVNINVR